MNEIDKLGESLEASIAKEGLVDIASGLADSSIEMLLEVGDGIPFFSYLTKTIKSVIAVKELIFYEKVVEFLKTIGEAPTAQRRKMIDQIASDTKYREKFGKVSLIVLDRLDDIFKVKLLGRVALHLIKQDINFELYRRFAFVIDKMYVSDISAFANDDDSEYKITNLESLGLISSTFEIKQQMVSRDTDLSRIDFKPDTVSVKRNETALGKALKAIVLNLPLDHFYKPYSNDTSKEFSDLLMKLYGNTAI